MDESETGRVAPHRLEIESFELNPVAAAPNESKASLRKTLKAVRDSLPPGLRHRRSSTILDTLQSRPDYLNANNLALTHSVGSEVDTVPLIEERLSTGKKVLLPRVGLEGAMEFHEVSDPLRSLVPSKHGIPEPDPRIHPLVPPETIDLILAPGVAFDPEGNRLGMGGGYFDRYLQRVPADVPVWGLAFECQIVDTVPHEDHDRTVDAVLTERAVYRAQSKEWVSKSVEETHGLAAQVIATLSPPLLIRLSGNLGAGKTEWVRGALHSMGWKGAVKSPTFTLENDYDLGDLKKIVHLDGYRLDSPSGLDLDRLGEILDDPESIVLVEWPERFGASIPFHAPRIEIKRLNDTERRIRWTAFEERHHL